MEPADFDNLGNFGDLGDLGDLGDFGDLGDLEAEESGEDSTKLISILIVVFWPLASLLDFVKLLGVVDREVEDLGERGTSESVSASRGVEPSEGVALLTETFFFFLDFLPSNEVEDLEGESESSAPFLRS